MQSYSFYEYGAVCLGAVGLTAAWRRQKKDAPGLRGQAGPWLVITQASSTEDSTYIPAADVTLFTVEALLALRGAIDEALRYDWQQPAAPPMTRWIPVAEELPDDNEAVLLVTDGEPWTGYRDGERWFTVSERAITESVTHWTPFPEPPND